MYFLYFSTVPSSPAHNVLVYSITSTSIHLSWDPPPDDQRNGIIVHYTVRIVPSLGGTNVYLNTTVTSTVITSLGPYTIYSCSVAAATSAGRGPFSSAIMVQTNEAGEYDCEYACAFPSEN